MENFKQESRIEVRNLSKSFNEENVIKDISFNIKEGEICGLLGLNGAGKSTIMKMIVGILEPDNGEILFNGKKLSKKNFNDIGALIEMPPIYENLSAYDNLKVRALLLGVDETQIHATLKLIGLENSGRKKAGKFSLGMKERLGLGMAILNEPKFLVLDEPTNGLDPEGIKELRDIIRTFANNGVSVLISSHQLNEISQLTSHNIIISEGEIGYDGKNDSYENLQKLFFEIVNGKKGLTI